MRSRAARVMSSAVAWIAIAGAAFFLFTTEQQLASRRSALREFDQHAREAASALADVRAGQQAYVAAGQGTASWVPKVSALIDQSVVAIGTLRASATSPEAQQGLVEAAAALTLLGNVDRRARDYIREGESLMAGDVIFAEGAEAAAGAVRQIEQARLAEHGAFDAEESVLRRLEALVLGGTAALTALVLAILAWAHGPAPRIAAAASSPAPVPVAKTPVAEPAPSKPAVPAIMKAPATPVSDSGREAINTLREAAALCTGFGSARDTADLSRLLAQAGRLMDASGLIVWLGSADGGDLRPVLAHGYPDDTLSRIPPVARDADNAAAAAYRTGSLQIVAARPGVASGALVAPIVAADGCIGALTAEIRDQGESSDATGALATIFAAQLAALLGASAAESQPAVIDRVASA